MIYELIGIEWFPGSVNGWFDLTRDAATSFDWRGGGRILVCEPHLPPNSDFSSDFGHFMLKIWKNLKNKIFKKVYKIDISAGTSPTEF